MSNPSFSLQGIISHKACIILAFDPGVPYSNKTKAKQSHVTEGGQTLTHVRQKNSDLPLLVASVAPEQALGTSPHFGGIEDIGGGKRLQVRCRLAWHCLVCKFWSISFFFAFCSTIWPLVTLRHNSHALDRNNRLSLSLEMPKSREIGNKAKHRHHNGIS